MMPEKPWSRIHVDHAINFMSNNWLIVTDAYSNFKAPLYPPNKLNIHPGDNLVARKTLHSFRIPSYNCIRQRNNVQFCRVPAMVPPERHQTPDWRSLPSSHQQSCREDGAVFQAVTEEVEAVAMTSTTGVPDAVSPYTTRHWLLRKPTPEWTPTIHQDRCFAAISSTHCP